MEFLQIIYYLVQSIWPVFFIAFVFLIWKDINRIANYLSSDYIEYEDDEEEEDEEIEGNEAEGNNVATTDSSDDKNKRHENDSYIEDLDV